MAGSKAKANPFQLDDVAAEHKPKPIGTLDGIGTTSLAVDGGAPTPSQAAPTFNIGATEQKPTARPDVGNTGMGAWAAGNSGTPQTTTAQATPTFNIGAKEQVVPNKNLGGDSWMPAGANSRGGNQANTAPGSLDPTGGVEAVTNRQMQQNSHGATDGNFVNFDQYFNANSGHAAGMANQIADRVGTIGNAAQKAMGSAVNGFGQNLNTNTLTASGAGYNSGKAKLGSAGQEQTENGYNPFDDANGENSPYNADGTLRAGGIGAAKQATLAALELDKANAEAGDRDFSHLFDEFNTAGKGVGEAQSAVNGLGSTAGLQANLQKLYGGANGNYSAGDSRNDAALTGAVSGKLFSDMKAKYGGVQKQYDTAGQAMHKSASDVTSDNHAIAAQAKANLDTYFADEEAKRIAREKAEKLTVDKVMTDPKYNGERHIKLTGLG